MTLSGIKTKLKRFKYPKQCPGIYFLFKKHKLIYIGQSIDINSRILAHLRSYIIHDYAYYIECPKLSSFQRRVLEQELIELHKPKLNKTWRHRND